MRFTNHTWPQGTEPGLFQQVSQCSRRLVQRTGDLNTTRMAGKLCRADGRALRAPVSGLGRERTPPCQQQEPQSCQRSALKGAKVSSVQHKKPASSPQYEDSGCRGDFDSATAPLSKKNTTKDIRTRNAKTLK